MLPWCTADVLSNTNAYTHRQLWGRPGAEWQGGSLWCHSSESSLITYSSMAYSIKDAKEVRTWAKYTLTFWGSRNNDTLVIGGPGIMTHWHLGGLKMWQMDICGSHNNDTQILWGPRKMTHRNLVLLEIMTHGYLRVPIMTHRYLGVPEWYIDIRGQKKKQ